MTIASKTVTIRVSSADTGGALLALDVHLPAGGGPPALRRHAAAELYRVEAGELTFHLEDDAGVVRRHTAGPGASILIQGIREHTVRNESDAVALAFVVFSPGAEMERFLRAVDALGADGASLERVLEIAARHGVEITRPVGR